MFEKRIIFILLSEIPYICHNGLAMNLVVHSSDD